MKNKTNNKPVSSFCIEILSTFSDRELKKFKDFVSSQYFNTDNYVIRLLEMLEKRVLRKRAFYTDIRDAICAELFSDKSSSKTSEKDKLSSQKALFNIRMNQLQKLAEKFLSIQAMEKKEFHQYELLARQLLDRKLFRLFERHTDRNRNLLEQKVAKEQEYYRQLYNVERNFYEFLFLNDKLSKEDNLSEMMYNLDIFYISNNLDIRLSAIALKENIGTKEYEFPYIETLDNLLKHPQYGKHPLIQLYIAAIRLKESKTKEAYNDLKNMLNKESNNMIPMKLLKDFYTTCVTYCTYIIRNGELSYHKDMLELYQIMHNKNLILDKGVMLPNQLKNMVIVGCKEGEFEWAKETIGYYRPFVLGNIRESVYNFNIGIIAFNQKEYDYAEDRFGKVKVGAVNSTYDINVRVLILKCIYEKEPKYIEYTEKRLRSNENYFNNHGSSLSADAKKGYKNFTQVLINLYRFRHGEGKITLERIKNKLDEQTLNADKKWLLAKIDEQEKGK